MARKKRSKRATHLYLVPIQPELRTRALTAIATDLAGEAAARLSPLPSKGLANTGSADVLPLPEKHPSMFDRLRRGSSPRSSYTPTRANWSANSQAAVSESGAQLPEQ